LNHQGIEAEYHARKDKVYCWRATRLVMATQAPWLDVPSTKDTNGSSLLDKVAANLKAEAVQAAALATGSSASPAAGAGASPVVSADVTMAD
jgi:hypothetical protein